MANLVLGIPVIIAAVPVKQEFTLIFVGENVVINDALFNLVLLRLDLVQFGS